MWRGTTNRIACSKSVMEPVSYTHLDVYKRQHIGSPSFGFKNRHLTSIFNCWHRWISRINKKYGFDFSKNNILTVTRNFRVTIIVIKFASRLCRERLLFQKIYRHYYFEFIIKTLIIFLISPYNTQRVYSNWM